MLFTELPRTLLPNPFYLLQLVATNEQPEHTVHYNRGARSSFHLRRTRETTQKRLAMQTWACLATAGKRQKSKTDPSTLVGTRTFFGKRHSRRWPPKIQSVKSMLTIFLGPCYHTSSIFLVSLASALCSHNRNEALCIQRSEANRSGHQL